MPVVACARGDGCNCSKCRNSNCALRMRIAFSIVMIFSLDIDESNKEVNVSSIWPVLLNLYCV